MKKPVTEGVGVSARVVLAADGCRSGQLTMGDGVWGRISVYCMIVCNIPRMLHINNWLDA